MMAKTKGRRRRLPLAVLCELLVLYAGLAQPSMAQATAQPKLRIVVVEGEGATNVAQQIAAKQLIVRVLDGNNRPVEGAAVTFNAPASGSSGDFANDSKSIRVLTNTDGVANAGLYHPNATTGAYLIQVRAEFKRALSPTVNISQMNVEQGKSHKKLIAIIAIAGVAAGAAIAARASGPSSSSTSGGSSVGGPK